MKLRKTIAALVCVTLMAGGITGCGSASNDNGNIGAESSQTISSSENNESQGTENPENAKRVAKDGADMQTTDKSMPTRKLPENGTRIKMHFGDTVIPGVLNDSETAKALIEMLPVTVNMNRYSHDFCGSASHLDLPYQENEVHYGWLNGDIDYAIDAPWFTVLFEDEDVSEQYGYQVNIGVIDCPLSDISSLDGSFEVLIELAD